MKRTLPALALALAAVFTLGTAGCAADAENTSSEEAVALTESAPSFSMGRHEGTRDGTEAGVVIDTQKMTYTGRGTLTLHVVFEPKSDREGADVPQADLFQMNFDLSFDEYVKLFESSDAVTIAKRQGDVYTESAEASGPKGNRNITIRWDNASGENTRKGEMQLALGENGTITRARMKRQAKTFLFGWKTVFDGSVTRPARTESGLLLLDDGKVGRVRGATDVKKAIDDPSPRNFETLTSS